MSQPNISDYDTDNNSEQDSLLKGQTGVSLNASTETNDGNGLEFVFNFADNVPQEIRDNIGKAGEAWSEVITDDVTVEIDVGFELETDGLANADSEVVEVSYSEFREALSNSATSENDAIALANLPEGDAIDLLINNTKENQGSDDVYLDDNGSENNSTITVNRSTAEALGLDVGEDVADATITFDQDVNWDYDASDGVAVDAFDFESIATHEIGHALGFNANVDSLDNVAGQNLKELIASGEVGLEDIAQALDIEVEDLNDLLEKFGLENIEELDLENFEELIAGTPIEPILESIQPDLFTSEDNYTLSSMDLFRYSDLSSDLGVIDFTTGESEKYFSLDGGNTEIAQFSTGIFLGDGGQISHWKDDLEIGIMDPTLGSGEIDNISQNDLQLLDAIGWDVVV